MPDDARLTQYAAAAVLGELTQALHAFFHALDQCRYADVLAAFTDDARWLRQGRWLDGRAAIGAALAARPADAGTRHVLSNAHVVAIDADARTVEVEAYMTAYRYPAPDPAGATPPTIAGPLRFNQTSTVFRREADGDWRIVEQRLVPVFAFVER